MIPIFLVGFVALDHHVELGLHLGHFGGAGIGGRPGHHHGAAGRRLDAVDVFQVIAQLLGLLEGQGDNLIAQILGGLGEFTGNFSSRHR